MKKAILLFLFCLPLLYLRAGLILYGLSIVSGCFFLFEKTPKGIQANKKPIMDIVIISGSIILIYAEAVLRLKGHFKTPEWHNIQYYIPNYSVAFYFIAGVVLYRKYNREEKDKKNTIKNSILVLLPVLISNVTYSVILPRKIIDGNWLEISTVVFQNIVLAAITEELFFRGFLYSSIKAYLGVVKAAVFSSVIFSLWHLNVLSTLLYDNNTINVQTLWQLFVIFILGVVNCIALERSKRLLLPVLYHIVNNGVCYFVISYLLA